MIVVTGSAGLVGTTLIESLVQQGKKVRAVYRSAKPAFMPDTIASQVEWMQADLLDVVAVEELMRQATQVYHAAALVSFNPKRKQELLHNNVQSTANMVNAAITAGVQKLVYVSSVAALGRIRKGEMITENMQWTPETSNSIYGKSKFLAEREVWRGQAEGLQTAIVNPSIILGPGDWHSGSSKIFKSVYEEFPFYTNGVSGFVDVRDVVAAMELLMNSEVNGERFIISAQNSSYREVFNAIADAFGKKRPGRPVQPWMAAMVWRWEAMKSFFTGEEPLLTKETALTAQTQTYFDNQKFLNRFPAFKYHSFMDTIAYAVDKLNKRMG